MSDDLHKQIAQAKEQIELYAADAKRSCGEMGSINNAQLEMWEYELESLQRKLRIAQSEADR